MQVCTKALSLQAQNAKVTHGVIGNTADFGSVILGSSPSGSTKQRRALVATATRAFSLAYTMLGGVLRPHPRRPIAAPFFCFLGFGPCLWRLSHFLFGLLGIWLRPSGGLVPRAAGLPCSAPTRRREPCAAGRRTTEWRQGRHGVSPHCAALHCVALYSSA